MNAKNPHWPAVSTPEELQRIGEYVREVMASAILSAELVNGELVLLTDHHRILPLLTFLRDDADLTFNQLSNLTAVDYPDRAKRFEVMYQLLSIQYNCRIRVKVIVDEETPVPSACEVFPSASWYEREVWDMYGVLFADHPDLRRILTDYGFDGHPLRRDFPLTGYVEMRYDQDKKRVVYEPVKLNQAYRSFDFLSPWEGAEYPLPGDEKAKGNG